jgi:hypothetical protein
LSFSLREEQRLRLFENGAEENMCTYERGRCRKLHNEELITCIVPKYNGDQIKDNEMGGTCSKHGRSLRTDGRIILKSILRKEDMGWLQLNQDRIHWRLL